MEVSSATLEERVVRYDYMKYKGICDITTKSDFPASNRNIAAVVACIPTSTMDPILRIFILALNRLWSFLFFHPGVSWVDLDDNKLDNTSDDFKNMECV